MELIIYPAENAMSKVVDNEKSYDVNYNVDCAHIIVLVLFRKLNDLVQ